MSDFADKKSANYEGYLYKKKLFKKYYIFGWSNCLSLSDLVVGGQDQIGKALTINVQVSISPIFYALFCTKVSPKAFCTYILDLNFFGTRILTQIRS
jgi:hypothetical protein